MGRYLNQATIAHWQNRQWIDKTKKESVVLQEAREQGLFPSNAEFKAMPLEEAETLRTEIQKTPLPDRTFLQNQMMKGLNWVISTKGKVAA